MNRRPPVATRTDPLLPDTTLFRSIAQPPEVVAFALAFGDHDIADQAGVDRRGELRIERLAQDLIAVARQFEQDMPGMGGGKRRACLGNMAQHRVETALRDQLETLERIPDGGVATAQPRSEERRGGKEGGRTCSSRGSP